MTTKTVVYCFRFLCDSMQNRTSVRIYDNSGNAHTGVVNGIRVEDGSGRHFLVQLTSSPEWIYLRAE